MNALLRDFPQTPLPAEREQELLVAGDTETIVMHAIVPAVNYCKRLSRGKLKDDELLSASYAALSKAIRNFHPGQQRFIGYSRAYLRGELSALWREKDLVRDSTKHETPIEKDKFPQPLESDSVEPDYGHYRELWAKIEPLIRKLRPKEIAVLELRYRAGYNLREVGERLGGLSRSRIKQIELKALKKIRAMLPKGLV